RKASNSSADSVMSNDDFGRSANSFLRRIYLLRCTQRITRDVSTDLRSEPRRIQPSSSLHLTPRSWVNRNLPLPIPREGRNPVALPLPDRRRRLSHRLEGPNRLRRLTP